jgi:hypothetical protein
MTFLNIPQLQGRRADMQTRVDCRNDDAIAQPGYGFIKKITGNSKKPTSIYMMHALLYASNKK